MPLKEQVKKARLSLRSTFDIAQKAHTSTLESRKISIKAISPERYETHPASKVRRDRDLMKRQSAYQKETKKVSRIGIKAAKKGVKISAKDVLKKLHKRLPKPPKTLLGGFAVPAVVKKMTDITQSRMKARGRRQGYLPKGKEL